MIPFSFVKTGTVAFNPSQLPSVKCWLDASNAGSVTLNGGNVSQINDRTSNADNAAQASAGLQPLYATNVQNGLNAIQFNADTKSLLLAKQQISGLSAFSICMLVKLPTGSATGYFYSAHNSGTKYRLLFYQNTTYLEGEAPGITGDPTITSEGGPGLSTSTWYRFYVIWDSTQSASNRFKIYQGGTDATHVYNTGSGSLPSVTDEILGDDPGIDTPSFRGHLGEFVITAAAMSPTDRSNLDTYWTTKWAV